jgi:hypothetical protein
MNILGRLFRSGTLSDKSIPLDRVRGFSGDLEYVEASADHPAYLIAHGEIISGSKRDPVATAVNPGDPYTDFSTNVGHLPNTSLGAEVEEKLNHAFDGKFVAFETEQPDWVDAVYVTNRPTDWLDHSRFEGELEHHANVKLAVDPILGASCAYGQQTADVPYPNVKRTAQEIVDDNLELQRRLYGSRAPGKYVQLPKTERKIEF